LRTKSTGLRQKKSRDMGAVSRVTGQEAAAVMCPQASLCCAWHGKCYMIQYTFSMSLP